MSWRHWFHRKTQSVFWSCGKRGPRFCSLVSWVCISWDCNVFEVSHCDTLSSLLLPESSKNCECSSATTCWLTQPPWTVSWPKNCIVCCFFFFWMWRGFCDLGSTKVSSVTFHLISVYLLARCLRPFTYFWWALIHWLRVLSQAWSVKRKSSIAHQGVRWYLLKLTLLAYI